MNDRVKSDLRFGFGAIANPDFRRDFDQSPCMTSLSPYGSSPSKNLGRTHLAFDCGLAAPNFGPLVLPKSTSLFNFRKPFRHTQASEGPLGAVMNENPNRGPCNVPMGRVQNSSDSVNFFFNSYELPGHGNNGVMQGNINALHEPFRLDSSEVVFSNSVTTTTTTTTTITTTAMTTSDAKNDQGVNRNFYPLPSNVRGLPPRLIENGYTVKEALHKCLSSGEGLSYPMQRLAGQRPSVPTIVLDSCNICCQHGKGYFSVMGVVLVVDYFLKRGHPVIAFMPINYIQNHYPDPMQDWKPIERLVEQNIIVSTPAGDYDDEYILKYAQLHCGYVVSNDKYRDIPSIWNRFRKCDADSRFMAQWIKRSIISFTFVGNEFIPNPRFDFKKFNVY